MDSHGLTPEPVAFQSLGELRLRLLAAITQYQLGFSGLDMQPTKPLQEETCQGLPVGFPAKLEPVGESLAPGQLEDPHREKALLEEDELLEETLCQVLC